MLKLIKRNVAPPGNFHYVDPDSGLFFKDMNLDDLTRQVADHRKANNRDVTNMKDIIEDWICQKMPLGICNDGSSPHFGRAHQFAETTVNRTITAWKAAKKSPYVSQEIAERRAKICCDCDNNISFAGCSSCRGVKSIKKEMLAGKTVSSSRNLRACGVTGLMNEVAVFLDRNELSQVVKSNLNKCSKSCWMKGEQQ